MHTRPRVVMSSAGLWAPAPRHVMGTRGGCGGYGAYGDHLRNQDSNPDRLDPVGSVLATRANRLQEFVQALHNSFICYNIQYGARTREHTHTDIHTSARAHAHTHTHTHTHTHPTHTHIYTHTNARARTHTDTHKRARAHTHKHSH